MAELDMLTLRATGLSAPAYQDWLDYVIVEDGRDLGRRPYPNDNRCQLKVSHWMNIPKLPGGVSASPA